jgi:hypothetical protein
MRSLATRTSQSRLIGSDHEVSGTTADDLLIVGKNSQALALQEIIERARTAATSGSTLPGGR